MIDKIMYAIMYATWDAVSLFSRAVAATMAGIIIGASVGWLASILIPGLIVSGLSALCFDERHADIPKIGAILGFFGGSIYHVISEQGGRSGRFS